MAMDLTTLRQFCRYCGNRKADHNKPYARRCSGFVAQEAPKCRVCGKGFDPGKSGREDCCYRHRMDS